MQTYFAPAERLTREMLQQDIDSAVANPVIDGLLNTVSGLVAVLNEHRQILAVNDAFLSMLGIDNADSALGLRPGEAIGCIHRDANEGGCGTSHYCRTCGAAIAIVSCMAQDEAVERTCAIEVAPNGIRSDLFLRVRACPLMMQGYRMVLLFIQDISHRQQWEALGRIFFHDISNIIQSLLVSSEMLIHRATHENSREIQRIHRLALRLAREVQMQKHLTQTMEKDYQIVLAPITVEETFTELKTTFSSHPAAGQRAIDFSDQNLQVRFKSDFFLLTRVLTNMIVNALEATDRGRTVKVWVDSDDRSLSFSVWNHQAIDKSVVDRIFQRNVSTKADSGRGLGTYSMKLFGEKYLKGKIDFFTSVEVGTTFTLRIPLEPPYRGSAILSSE
ncbi:ATP-binding protein [Breoghania sp.]|uniref:ATP-binding protein n=1 Tax=Breoghania sp. TaxID=2065378 RepID=UPI0029C6D299|nr:ATP-binding protein [Breoghania sp.]